MARRIKKTCKIVNGGSKDKGVGSIYIYIYIYIGHKWHSSPHCIHTMCTNVLTKNGVLANTAPTKKMACLANKRNARHRKVCLQACDGCRACSSAELVEVVVFALGVIDM